jgi:hypothetical protein
MPIMKSELVIYKKATDELGNTIEIKIWQVRHSTDKPYGYKYSLAYIVNDIRVIGYDNAEKKGDHKHYKQLERSYEFKDIDKLLEDFYKDIEKYREGSL